MSGADVGDDAARSSALIIASQEGKRDVAEVLLRAGADVDMQNTLGQSAMHGAGLPPFMLVLVLDGEAVLTFLEAVLACESGADTSGAQWRSSVTTQRRGSGGDESRRSRRKTRRQRSRERAQHKQRRRRAPHS
eukprot:318022-Rhodomonas_salina.4